MKAKTYKAAVTNKETGKLEVITRDDYTSKKDFAHDLRVNGYAVRFISTPEKFDEDCEKYHWELERRKNVREAMKQHKASKEQDEQEVQEVSETETNETTAETTAEQETTTETDDSGFEYYSVKAAYEVIKDEIRSALFTSYSLALKVAKDFTDMWDGDKAIVIAVNFVIRNDRQPESERDKRVLETETAEIERRCVPYHDWGLSGYVSIEDRQDIA